jgi:Ca2+-binding RTX toxin-like protein
MLGLLSVLGLMMAGVVGGSLALRPDEDEASDTRADAEGDAAPEDPLPVSSSLLDDPADPGPALVAPEEPAAEEQGVLSEEPPSETRLAGGRGNDGIEGGDGRERIFGRTGDDQLNGGGGNDGLSGADGDDSMTGGYGHDRMRGGDGADLVAGQEGNDRLSGDAGDDTLLGGNGNDSLWAGSGQDWLAGGMGNDLLVAGEGQDTLDGDAGDDTLVGAFLSEAGDWGHYLNGGEGNDVLRMGGTDIATGGNGADRFEIGADGQAGVASITDFDAVEDEIVVIYDGAGPVPVVSLAPGGMPDSVMLMVDGLPMAQVQGGGALTPGAIRLVAG